MFIVPSLGCLTWPSFAQPGAQVTIENLSTLYMWRELYRRTGEQSIAKCLVKIPLQRGVFGDAVGIITIYPLRSVCRADQRDGIVLIFA